MFDIRTFDKTLKISWVKKIWDENYHADWQNLYVSAIGYWKDVWLLDKKNRSNILLLTYIIPSGKMS